MIGALEKVLMLLQKTGRMPIKTAIKKTGQQIGKTGKAMYDNPRAAIGGAAGGGALAAYLSKHKSEDEELEELLAQLEGGGQNVY